MGGEHETMHDDQLNGTDLVILRSKSVSSDCFAPFWDHIQEVGAEFVREAGEFYPILLQDKVCGVLWEHCPADSFLGTPAGSIHFGIFTYPDTPKGLHIVERYLKLKDGRHLFLHTTPKCGVASFYQKKYGFHLCKTIGNRILLEKA